MGDIVIFFTAIFAVLGRNDLNPGLVGLSLSFALQVQKIALCNVHDFKFSICGWSWSEVQMSS